MHDRIRIATLNLLYYPQGDRWRERRPLVEAELRILAPDVIGLQEVNRPIDQDHDLAASAGPELDYQVFRASETARRRYPRHWDGVVFLAATSAGEILGHEVRRLPSHTWRWPSRVRRSTGPGASDAGVARRAPAERRRHDRRRFQRDPGGAGARPVASGRLPLRLPSGQRIGSGHLPVGAVASWNQGPESCDDYIWVRGAAEVVDARLAFDRPSVEDPGLYPSDHRGLVADLALPD